MSASRPSSPTSGSSGGPAAGGRPNSAVQGSDPAANLSHQSSTAAEAGEPPQPSAAAGGAALVSPAAEADPTVLRLQGMLADLNQRMSDAGDGVGQVHALRSWKDSHFGREVLAEVQRELQATRSSEALASMDPESQRRLDKMIATMRLADRVSTHTDQMLEEAEDFMLPKQEPQPQPGAQYLEACLQRAAALPAGQCDADVAAFLESEQLCREVCELLPLAPSGRPALPTMVPGLLLPAVELALAKFWQAVDLCPCNYTPICNANLWQPLAAYLQHRTPSAIARLIQEIALAGPEGVTEDDGPGADSGGSSPDDSSSGSSAGSSGNHSHGPASPDAATTSSASSSTSASSYEGDGPAEHVGPHGVPVSSAPRVALLLATCGRVCQFTLGAARLLRAAVDIASDPECAAAIDSRLTELATRQHAQQTTLRLTARQLRCACCATLAQLNTACHPGPERTPPMEQLPIMRMYPAEMLSEVLAAVAAGTAGALQLEPHSARALLSAGIRMPSGQLGNVSVQAVEHCLHAVQAARQQGSRVGELHAAAHALRITMVLLAGLDSRSLPSMEGGTGAELVGGSTAEEGSSSQAGAAAGGLQGMLGAASRKKLSGKGAGAKRRQQHAAAKQYDDLQQEVAAARETAPSLKVETVQAVLEAFRQAGELLKACKQVLPDQWVRQAAEAWRSVEPLGAAVQAFLDEAQRSGSSTVSAGRRRSQALGQAMQAAVRSGNWGHVADVLRELGVELQTGLSCLQSLAYLQLRSPNLLPVCSSCGAVAVGLRKCSACKRAQYCSAECQKRHWPAHRAECRASAAAASGGGGSGG